MLNGRVLMFRRPLPLSGPLILVLLLFGLIYVNATEAAIQEEDSSSIALTQDITSPNQAQEAAQAHHEALQTLSFLESSSSQPTSSTTPRSLLSSSVGSFLPISNQRGPIASALRIVHRLRQQSWIPRPILFLLNFGGPGPHRNKSDEELSETAIKILDLLEHAIELGDVDALYTMGRVSLFPPAMIPRNITRAYNAFRKHAQLTGNATSYSLWGFFHGTGYKPFSDSNSHIHIDVDQARALLYYTFAANQGDYHSQMALGYRYWSGIGVHEDCLAALGWYEAAAEQAMEHFLSGPPGGRTLPLTHTKLSDLAGGVFGPGASVASTGLLANRFV